MERLIKTIFLALIVCTFLFVPCLSSADPSHAHKERRLKNLHYKSESASPAYYATEPLIVRFEIKNESKTPIRVLLWGTPFEGFSSDMFEITKDGVEIPYRGKLVSRGAPTDADYITLKENQSITTELDLSEAYHVMEEGEYVLNHRMRTLTVDLYKGQGTAKKWTRHRHHVEHQHIAFKQKGIRQIGKQGSRQNDPNIQRSGRMYAQASDSTSAADCPKDTNVPKCNLNNFKMPEYEISAKRQNETVESYNVRMAEEKDRQNQINEAFCEALQMAAEAKVILNGIPKPEIRRGVDRYEAYFGDADEKTVRLIFGTIYNYGFPSYNPNESAVKFINASAEACTDVIRYNDPDSHEAVEARFENLAYVKAGEALSFSKNIYLCPKFWCLPMNDKTASKAGISKAGTVLHELAHLTMGAFPGESREISGRTVQVPPKTKVYDYQYFEAGCMFLAQYEPEKSSLNADSYARFAMNRHDFSVGLDRPYVRLSNASGASLVVEKNALRMSSKPDPIKSLFALSNPKESKLIFPADNNARCRDSANFNSDCAVCDDPDRDDPICDTQACDCLLKINENWKPYSPVSGDQVQLVSSDRKSVVTPPGTPGGPVRVDSTTAISQGLKLVSTNTAESQLGEGAEIALQTAQELYLSVADDGSVIASRSDQPGDQEKFTVSFSNQERFYVQFRSRGNRYVSIYRRFSGIGDEKFIAADEKDAADCRNCTFVMVNKNGPGLKDGDAVYLMAKDGRGYVAAINERTSGFVEIDSTNTGIPQVFTIKKDDPSGDVAIRTGDVISLVTESGNVVRTGPGGTGQLYASYVGKGQVNENIQMKFIIELGR